jgi:type VII secretion-associated serine protease mycosin
VTLSEQRKPFALLCVAAIFAVPGTASFDRIRNDQWHLRYLRITEAHKQSSGGEVTVAVVDTGVDPHPDLRDNLLPGTDLTTRASDGREDVDSHGTGIAGLIAAHGNGPSSGALGIAPHGSILPIRDRGPLGQGTSDNLARGIEWALQHDVDVINVSSGGGPSPRLRQAIDAAAQAGVVVVAAVGNRPSDLGVTFPAAYEGVLAVGATDREGDHADVSVTGKQVAISAPGVDIYSTSIDGKYSKATGTSASTAIVSGAVALVRSKYPDLSAREVVHRLTATATDKGPPGRDEQYGYGVLNLVAALTADVPALDPAATGSPSTTAAAAPPDRPDGGNSARVWVAALAATLAVGVTTALIGVRRRRSAGR